MPSPFKDPTKVKIEEWSGQYDCLEIVNGRLCHGYARVAKYVPSERLLTWKCQDGHTSILDDVDDE